MNVREIQNALNSHGFPCSVDGIDGPETKMQVSRFQLAFCGPGGWLEVDGLPGPATQKALEWTVANNALVTHFSIDELNCNDGCRQAYVKRELLAEMFKLRQGVGRPVGVASVYRCERHNARIGGAKNSRHIQGLAFDPTNVTVGDIKTHTKLTGIGSPQANKKTGAVSDGARGTHADLRPGGRITFYDASNG